MQMTDKNLVDSTFLDMEFVQLELGPLSAIYEIELVVSRKNLTSGMPSKCLNSAITSEYGQFEITHYARHFPLANLSLTPRVRQNLSIPLMWVLYLKYCAVAKF